VCREVLVLDVERGDLSGAAELAVDKRGTFSKEARNDATTY
jgi:hypothetical protein